MQPPSCSHHSLGFWVSVFLLSNLNRACTSKLLSNSHTGVRSAQFGGLCSRAWLCVLALWVQSWGSPAARCLHLNSSIPSVHCLEKPAPLVPGASSQFSCGCPQMRQIVPRNACSLQKLGSLSLGREEILSLGRTMPCVLKSSLSLSATYFGKPDLLTQSWTSSEKGGLQGPHAGCQCCN